MNYEKIIKGTLRLQGKIIKACGREFGSLKSFNSKYSLSAIDYTERLITFYKKKTDEEEYIAFSFELIETKGYGTHHSIKATLIK